MGASDRFVHLQGGCVLPLTPCLLALELEARGFTLSQEGATLVVSPPDKLTPEDCARITRWKGHLFLVMAYTPTDAHLRDSTVPAPPTGPIVTATHRKDVTR